MRFTEKEGELAGFRNHSSDAGYNYDLHVHVHVHVRTEGVPS